MDNTSEAINITHDIKQQAERMLFIAKSNLHKAQEEARKHNQSSLPQWQSRDLKLELSEQRAFIEFEQILGIINGVAHSNYGGRVTPEQWGKLQEKFAC